MYQLEKIFTFEAGHLLTSHDGKCKQPHGHSYVLTVILRSDKLIQSGPKRNMVMDFSSLTEIVRPMIEQYFDHKWLNDSLHEEATTMEFISKWIYDYLKPHLPDLYAITLAETATIKVTYSPS